jgi:alkanesulfonate monooxygenase SsuD/methylene tetrahydromethanopterin reductase-like flavin-dependent oxidoreductase (luciferase family)
VPPLHLGLILPNYGEALDSERLAGVAIAAEQAGLDSGWVTDHVIVPAEHAPTYGTIAEALVSLASSQRARTGSSLVSRRSSSPNGGRSSR